MASHDSQVIEKAGLSWETIKGCPMRVLLIEDEPTTAKAIDTMLTTEGFNVYTTDLGEEGLDLGKLYDYDIILLDLNLPDMHGYDVLKKLRTAKVQTPVLILSGISEMPDRISTGVCTFAVRSFFSTS